MSFVVNLFGGGVDVVTLFHVYNENKNINWLAKKKL